MRALPELRDYPVHRVARDGGKEVVDWLIPSSPAGRLFLQHASLRVSVIMDERGARVVMERQPQQSFERDRRLVDIKDEAEYQRVLRSALRELDTYQILLLSVRI